MVFALCGGILSGYGLLFHILWDVVFSSAACVFFMSYFDEIFFVEKDIVIFFYRCISFFFLCFCHHNVPFGHCNVSIHLFFFLIT